MPSLKQELEALYAEGKERIGFVLQDGSIIEVENICDKPEDGFEVKGEDIMQFTPVATAMWHTHPGETNNLSLHDYESFRNWPNHDHWIIGTNGARRYWIEDDEVLQDG